MRVCTLLRYVFGSLIVLSTSVQTGSIYKCKQPDGSITFSNVSCPYDTVDREYKGEHRKRSEWENENFNPYSVNNQVRQIEQREAQKKYQRSIQSAPSKTYPRQQISPAPSPVPTMTYKAARDLATKEAGYRNYNQLTKSQRDMVHDRMEKYNYLPKEHVNNDEQQRRNAVEAQNRASKERQRLQDIRQTYRREKNLQEIGVQGRESRYNRAAKDCKFNPSAHCQ